MCLMECIIYKIMTAKDKKDEKKKIFSEENILEYLVKNPNLINHNIDLFNKLFSLDKNKGNIISFEDIRIKSLINENNYSSKWKTSNTIIHTYITFNFYLNYLIKIAMV